VAVISVAVWYPAFRQAAKKGMRLNRALVAAGMLITLFAVGAFEFPFRLLTTKNKNQFFPIAKWQGASCYVFGERGTDVLLFCPRLTPRKRVITDDGHSIGRTGASEHPFTQFQPPEDKHGV
jgi:hypothetical protein